MEDYSFLEEMYEDDYYPSKLVEKIEKILRDLCDRFSDEGLSLEEQQDILDEAIMRINDLQDKFLEQDSELETSARECIGADVEKILDFYNITIDIEDALREREW